MSPTRALSESAKVLAELARQLRAEEKMALETLKVFIDLLATYGKAVRAATPPQADASIPGKASGVSQKQVEEWILQNGTPGAYERMHGGEKEGR